ncbi:MAG: hypothetical protein Q9227_000857 [Pyrenula ochraceoflavens]
MARALDANGAHRVFLLGRRLEALQHTASTCKNGSAIPIVADVVSKDSLGAAAAQVSKEVDHVDVVLANSGISGPRAEPPPNPDGAPHSIEEVQKYLWEIPMEDFTRTSHVNVTGVLYTAVAFLPLLVATNKLRETTRPELPRPQIIATGSIGGFNRMPLAGFAYGASKAAAHHMVKSMATMWGKYDIRVNALAPGLYASEMTNDLFSKKGDPMADGQWPREQIPMTRAGREEEMAGVVLWMCSKAGGYTTGTVILTDGGRLSVHPATY